MKLTHYCITSVFFWCVRLSPNRHTPWQSIHENLGCTLLHPSPKSVRLWGPACTDTGAQDGVSLVTVSLFNSLFKQSRLHCLDVHLTWSRLYCLGVWSRLHCLGLGLTWHLWHLFVCHKLFFFWLHMRMRVLVRICAAVCVSFFWVWSVNWLSRMKVYHLESHSRATLVWCPLLISLVPFGKLISIGCGSDGHNRGQVSQRDPAAPGPYAYARALRYDQVGLGDLARWLLSRLSAPDHWLASHLTNHKAEWGGINRLGYIDVLVVMEIGCRGWFSPKIHASPKILWTVLPTRWGCACVCH